MNINLRGGVQTPPLSLLGALTKEFIKPTTVLYHGTTGNFDKFDIHAPRNDTTPKDEINAIFFSTDKAKAFGHGNRKARKTGEKVRIIEATVDFKHLYDATDAIKKLQKKTKNFGQAKRQIYQGVDRTKYDGIEFRGDSVNDPEYVVFDPKIIHIKENKKMEASIKPTILKNPPVSKLKTLIKNAQYNELKGLISGKDVYWWNQVEDWHHHHQYEKLGKGVDPTDPFMKNPTWNKDRLILQYVNNNPNEIALVNNDAEESQDVFHILKNNYLRKLIIDGDLFIDNPDVPFNINNVIYIKGKDYMKKHKMEASDFNKLLCWIDADGKEIDVTGTDSVHAGTFRRLLSEDSALKERYENYSSNTSQNSIYLFATRDLGWIRASGHGKYFYCMITKNKAAPRAISALAKILKDYPEYEDYVLDYYDSYDDSVYHQFYKLSDLVAELRKNADKSLTASFSEYGYWLHDGKVADVGYQGHQPYANKHFKDETSLAGYNYAFKKGWIRAVNEYHGNLSLELWYGHVTRGALKALSELITKQNIYKGFTVELRRGINDAVLPEPLRQRWFIFKEGEERQVLDLVRQCLNKEMTASDEQYGFWFTNKGEQLDVEEMRHNYIARTYVESNKEIENMFNKYVSTAFYSEIYKEFVMKELGWIRCTVTDQVLGIEIYPGKVNLTAFKALRRYLDKENDSEEYLLDIVETSNRFIQANKKQVLYNDIQKQVNKEMTASDDYGYWITDKGGLLKVDYESHNSVADKYIHDHFYKEYLAWVQETDVMDSTEFALTKGFIRIVVEGSILNVEVDKSGITRDAYRALSKFYNEHYFDTVNLDATFQRTTTTHKRFSDYENDLNKFLPFARTYISKKNMEASDTVYGYWITSDGSLLKVPTDKIGHAGVLKKYDKDMFTPEQWERIDGANYYAILGKGWIRIAVEGYNSCNIEIMGGSVTREAYKKLVVLLKSNKYNDFNLDIQRGHALNEVDYDTFDRAGQLLSAVEKNVGVSKTIVAIDEDNNVTGRYSQIAIERWQPDDSADQIQLLNIGQDFVIRSITGSDSSDMTPFKFVETARRALLHMVRDMEKIGVIYKKQAITTPVMQAADDVVLKRWETASGKHAITLSKDDQGSYAIEHYIKLPSGEYKKGASSFLGKANLEEALARINKELDALSSLDSGFKEVRVGKVLEDLTPKKEATRAAQVTVRGKTQDFIDGYKKFSKQPDFPGLSVYTNKVGAYTYAKLVHEPSGFIILNLTSNPLSISPSELVQRLNISGLKKINWNLPKEQLFNKYGQSTLLDAVSKFNKSLDMKMQDKTDLALEDGLKGWVKDYIVALYFKRVAESKRLQKQIDTVIQKQGLDKNKVYFYYGNPAIKTDEAWKKVGLERIGTSSPYTYRFAPLNTPTPTQVEKPKASPLDQAMDLIGKGASLDSAVRQVGGTTAEIQKLKQDVKLAIQRSARSVKETGDKAVQSQGNYTWSDSRKLDKKTPYTLKYKGVMIGSILVDDPNFVKTLQSFGNDKSNPTVFDSPYTKDLSMRKGPTSNIYASYDLYSGTNKVAILYRPTPEVHGIVKRINEATAAPPPKAVDPKPVKSGMVGSFVSGTDKFGDRVEGILLTEKKNPRTLKSDGVAVIIDEDDVPIKATLKNVRRKLVKPPKELLQAYKTMGGKVLESSEIEYPELKGTKNNWAPYYVRRVTVDDRPVYRVFNNGHKVGYAKMSGSGKYVSDLEINKEHQRRGIANALYDYIEKDLNIKLEPSPMHQTPEGKAFWKNRVSSKDV